jgi:hypothetical protein
MMAGREDPFSLGLGYRQQDDIDKLLHDEYSLSDDEGSPI